MKITAQKIHLFAMMMVSLSVLIGYAFGTLQIAAATAQLALVGLSWLIVRGEK